MKKYLPLAATAVIFVASLIILATPLRPQITSVTPELNLTPTQTDWKTYRNDEYGFEFQYPAFEEVIAWEGRNDLLCLKHRDRSNSPSLCKYIEIFQNPQKLTLLNFVRNQQNYSQFQWNKTNLISKYDALRYDAEFMVQDPDTKNIVRLSFSGINDQENQILSTFKFTQ